MFLYLPDRGTFINTDKIYRVNIHKRKKCKRYLGIEMTISLPDDNVDGTYDREIIIKTERDLIALIKFLIADTDQAAYKMIDVWTTPIGEK